MRCTLENSTASTANNLQQLDIYINPRYFILTMFLQSQLIFLHITLHLRYLFKTVLLFRQIKTHFLCVTVSGCEAAQSFYWAKK